MSKILLQKIHDLERELLEHREFHQQSLEDWTFSNEGYEQTINELKLHIEQFRSCQKTNYGNATALHIAMITLCNSTPKQSLKINNRKIAEDAHMAGYHSCCERDASYSDARVYANQLEKNNEN